jgi:hypothetical protein
MDWNATMTRYFFNLSGDPYKLDEEGTDLQDYTAAKSHAVLCAARFMKDSPLELVNGRDISLEITDEWDRILCVVNVTVTNAPAG